MKSLIIGAGEVGKALFEVIKPFHESYIRDIDDLDIKGIQILHICYPDHVDFRRTTLDYIAQYEPEIVVIHSSVKIGTTESIGKAVVYSPVRGRHPKLAEEMKIYEKYVGCSNEEKMVIALDYFRQCGLTVKEFSNPAALEFCKIVSNVHMGLEIAWRQEVKRMMDQYEIPDFIYGDWETSYADGYKETGDFHLMRPRLESHPIGGHCILPCLDILGSQYASLAFDFIRLSNQKAKMEQLKEDSKEKKYGT